MAVPSRSSTALTMRESETYVFTRLSSVANGGLYPMLPENDEGDVVGDQESGNPKCRYPVGRAHVDGGLVYRRERDGEKQIHRSEDVEQPDQGTADLRVLGHGWNGNEGEKGGDQVADGRRTGELRRHSRVDGSPGQEHESEVPKRVQQEDGKENAARSQLPESWQKVESGGDVEHYRRGDEIEGEYSVQE